MEELSTKPKTMKAEDNKLFKSYPNAHVSSNFCVYRSPFQDVESCSQLRPCCLPPSAWLEPSL